MKTPLNSLATITDSSTRQSINNKYIYDIIVIGLLNNSCNGESLPPRLDTSSSFHTIGSLIDDNPLNMNDETKPKIFFDDVDLSDM